MRLSSGWGFSDQLSFFTLYYNRGVPEYVLVFFFHDEATLQFKGGFV